MNRPVQLFCALSDSCSLLDSLDIEGVHPLDEIVPFAVEPESSLCHLS